MGRPAAPARPPESRGDRWFRRAALLPAVAVLAALTGWPILNLPLMAGSTVTFDRAGAILAFTPGENLHRLASDRLFLESLLTTLRFVAVSVTLELILGFLLALLVARVAQDRGLIRGMMVLPVLMPSVAIAGLWKLLYNADFGLLNRVLGLLGLGPVGWLSNPALALWSVVAVDVWHWTPFVFLILLAGLETLPREVIEAARLDGATGFRLVRFIILPLMAPALAAAFALRAVLAFKLFDQVFLLTAGGPGTATELVSLRLYHVLFTEHELGYGALLALTLILATGIFLAAARALTRRFGR